MKKYIIAFTLLFILFACGDVKEKINNISNEKVENGLTKYNLKGKVKEVEEKEYSIKKAFGETVKDELKRINNKLEFDLKGNLTQTTMYYDSTISSYYIYVYDRNGDNIEYSYYNKEGEILWNIQTNYEKKRVRSESKSYNRDSLRSITKYEYDNNDQLIKNSVYNLDGELQSYWLYEYDKEGNMIKITHKNAKEDIIEMIKRQYDLNGNMTQSITYNGEGKEIDRYTNVYNEQGLRIQYDNQYTSKRSGIKSTYSYTNNHFEFDDRGNWIKYIRYIDYGDNMLDTTLFERTYTYY